MRLDCFKSYVLSVLTFVTLCVFRYVYATSLLESLFFNYLPNEVVYPTYSSIDGSVTNAKLVTVWSYADFVPWWARVLRYIADSWLILITLFVVNILLFSLVCVRYKKNDRVISVTMVLLLLVLAMLAWTYFFKSSL